jgi:uncharacterized protein YndB with AHSA1/START domain
MPTFPTSPYFQPIWADDAYQMNKFGIGKLKPMPIKNEFKNMFPGGGSDAQTYFTENARREAMARVENTKLAKLGMEGRRNTTARSQRYDRDMSRSAVPNGQFYGSPMDYSVTAGGLRGGVITSPEGQEWLARRLAERAQEFENIQTGNFSKGPPREIDLQPGGQFFVQMVDPEGNKLPANRGCYLEIVPDRKIVWTSAMGPGYRPHSPGSAPWFFTAEILLEPHGQGGCRYVARAIHSTVEDAQKHEQMGFSKGWGAVLDQLVEYVKSTPMNTCLFNKPTLTKTLKD